MQTKIQAWLDTHEVVYADMIAIVIALVGILVTGFLVYQIVRLVTRRILQPLLARSHFLFIRRLCETRLFIHLNYLAVGLALNHLVGVWLEPGKIANILTLVAQIWILFNVLLLVYALLDTFSRWSFERNFAAHFPMGGVIQTFKLITSIGIGIAVVSLLIGQSPVILLSGLGAMTAVLMLVFKDPILGLVAGIQLSANNMLRVGDWLEMQKYNADGDVIDIGLTTVKVRNWDKTVTTIPTYALISDSFKNYRPMSESGGRRIKRAFLIDSSSIRFISEQDVQRFTRSSLLADYIIEKSKEIDSYNQKADLSLSLNGRRLTNIGTFRAYLQRYLNNHPKVHKGMTIMVRQLAPTSDGVPIEIYCFSNDVVWVNYEGIQSDIFDHIFAVVGEFGLRIHQNPTGYDLQSFAQSAMMHKDKEND